MEQFINIAYIVASIFFIVGLKMLGSPATARKGNIVSGLGMLIAVSVTLFDQQILDSSWIFIGIVIGGAIGLAGAKLVGMTEMPQMVAVFNGLGGMASLLVGCAEFEKGQVHSALAQGSASVGTVAGTAQASPNVVVFAAIFLAVIIGGVTFSGSVIAYAKLAERMNTKPILFRGQNIFNTLVVLLILSGGVLFAGGFLIDQSTVLYAAVGIALLFGVLAVIPIGGADMPVVISLLNSYSGLAACAAGFIILNNVLIVSGALVGASGIILTKIMCKAMNRSLANVLFSGFGSGAGAAVTGDGEQGEVNPINVEDAYLILEAASTVCVVPGYGMAVAQAQHVVRELGELFEENGTEVKYAIHPVAGRMPGHMNVLLAEANVSYDQLVEPDDINPTMENVDVCIVIGANDVVNPDARNNESSPIYGMPIINVDKARTVFVLKRSMAAGFAGVMNPLFFKENTRMLFGDAKASIAGLVGEYKA